MSAHDTYVALLRGVNVGGVRKLPMAELRASLSALGLHDVRTYLQSGNVVFRAREADGLSAVDELPAAIRACIGSDFGHDVEVLVLSASRLAAIAASNPFAVDPDVDIKPLHATFLLGGAADAATFSALKLPADVGEEAAWGSGVVYLRLPHGYGRTKLNNGYFERALSTTATTRNWRTVLALAETAAESE